VRPHELLHYRHLKRSAEKERELMKERGRELETSPPNSRKKRRAVILAGSRHVLAVKLKHATVAAHRRRKKLLLSAVLWGRTRHQARQTARQRKGR